MKKPFFYRISSALLLLLFVSVSFCDSVKKKEAKPVTFSYGDFESVVLEVNESYIDKMINKNRAYTDAAMAALSSLPHGLLLYPESYFREREKYEDDLIPGKTFKLAPSDKFLLLDPDFVKMKELQEEKEKKNGTRTPAHEVEKIIEKDKVRKAVLYARWEETGFGKKDFDRVLAWIKDNVENYKTSPDPEEHEELKKAAELFTINNVYLAAANGYLNSLDPHSSVFSAEEWEESMSKIQDSSFEGIGAILSGGGNRDVVVENPLEGRPAVKAGIRAGDIIVNVDEKPVKGLLLDKVVTMIKGPKGTDVKLTIRRKGQNRALDIVVKRDKIEIKNISSNLVKDHEHIGYIKLSGFIRAEGESVEDEIIRRLEELEAEAKKKNTKLKGIVLDLRNNAGGYLDLAVNIADMFIKKGLIVSVKGPGYPPDDKMARISDISDLPLAVLVNARSASASEIVASAIKHHGRGLILGERTFGKATVQKLMRVPSNSSYNLKITQARYYAPSGKTIQVVGVKPDVEISSEEDGTFPFQYREENMWNHLPKIPHNGSTHSRFNIARLDDWVKRNGTAKAILEKRKNDAIKPDYQLIRSLDYVEALINVK